jgi:hypothetical protein
MSAVSESQQSGKHIPLVKVTVTTKDKAQHYKGKRFQFLKQQSEQRRERIWKKGKSRSRLIGTERLHNKWKADTMGTRMDRSKMKESRRMSGTDGKRLIVRQYRRRIVAEAGARGRSHGRKEDNWGRESTTFSCVCKNSIALEQISAHPVPAHRLSLH